MSRRLLVVVLVLGVAVLSFGGMIVFILRDQSKEAAANSDDSKQEKAHKGCIVVEQACRAYMNSPQNPGRTPEEMMPQDISNLYQVPFGGPSYLENGQADTIDPWGNPYQFEMRQRTDATLYIFVFTQAPDGTLISQFGIGNKAYP